MKFAISVVASILVPGLILIGVGRGLHALEHGIQWTGVDVTSGREIFAARCARCHNLSGTAVAIGPNLSQIGELAAQRKPGLNAAEYILESIIKPREFKAPGSSGEMPVNLVNSYDDDDIRSLVAFLCTKGGAVTDSELKSLQILRPPEDVGREAYDRQQVQRGEQVFRGKGGCVKCHPFYGGSEFELFAPYLFYRGHLDRDAVQKAILQPHASVSPRYQQTGVELADGKVLVGQILGQNEDQLVMQVNLNGEFQQRRIALSEIEKDEDGNPVMIRQSISSMPSGLDSLLTPEELNDLLAFLLSAN